MIEAVVALGIISSCVGWQLLAPTQVQRDWPEVEREFTTAYLASRESTDWFMIRFEKTRMLVGEFVIDLPTGWETRRQQPIEVRQDFVSPGRRYFTQSSSGARKQLVFQFGGGTYDFR